MRGSDFLDICDLSPQGLRALLDLARDLKSGKVRPRPLAGRSIALLFQKPSMRTRVSFEVGIERLGGTSIVLGDAEVGVGRREPAGDVAGVLARYVDGIVARLFDHKDLLEMARASNKPVINALTDKSHPCQVLADLMTMDEALGGLDRNFKVAFVGDGNNVVYSLIEAHLSLGFQLAVVSPPAYRPAPELLARAPGVQLSGDLEAVRGADVVYTDVWTSMGRESEAAERRAQFEPYRVDAALMARAPGARFMHCLPAHRGEEVEAEVLDGPNSLVLDQAENRLWAQMALLAAIF